MNDQGQTGNGIGAAMIAVPSAGSDSDPKILGFLCNWCAYAGADLAGVSRVQYPPDMRVIRVMCSGRVDPVLILRAFREGSDGVSVLGCHHGDCHYQVGNYQAERKIQMTLKVLEKIGIEPQRLYLDWVSAAEGTRFGEVVTSFIQRIKELGPIDRAGDFDQRIALGEAIISNERIRWLVGKELELIEEGNVYHEKVGEDEFKKVLWDNIDQEFHRERILSVIENQAKSVKTIAEEVDMTARLVFRYLTEMENNGYVILDEFQGNTPLYLKVRSPEAQCEEGGA